MAAGKHLVRICRMATLRDLSTCIARPSVPDDPKLPGVQYQVSGIEDVVL